MKNSFGNSLKITIFGESHGKALGAVIDGIAPGIEIDENYIAKKLTKRRPLGKISTARSEEDNFKILSGVYNGYTTGTPIGIIIENSVQKSSDYDKINGLARPGHADYTAFCKYHGFEDRRGGGHQSARVTAAVVAAGAIVLKALEDKNIFIATHLKKCGGISDRDFDYENPFSDFKALAFEPFPVLDKNAGEDMKKAIMAAKEQNDSIGGIIETMVTGVPAGVGEPWFDSFESIISHILFSVPAVKGIEFGDGFSLCDKKGSEANDPYRIKDGKPHSPSHSNGGILGGITDSNPIIFRCAVKPTPSIAKPQKTIDFIKNENAEISVKGRHDPCVAHRAAAVADAVTALAVADLCVSRFGTDWLSKTI